MRKVLLVFSAITLACSAIAQEWSPVGNNIKTEWVKDVDPSCPRPEYPRPQMVRGDWMNLNGLWNYAITPRDAVGFKTEGQAVTFLELLLTGHTQRLGGDLLEVALLGHKQGHRVVRDLLFFLFRL